MNNIKNIFFSKSKKNEKNLIVGIDINEIFRANWLQFDRYYVQEFGEEGVPKDQPYVYNFFKYYKWNDTIEINKELKEPEDIPDNINPKHYQIDENTGEADADVFLFKKPEKIKLTANEVYNRFMYQDYLFELFGSAPLLYRGMDLHVKNFYDKYKNTVDFILLSVENDFTIPPTLFFLSKMMSRFNKYYFVKTNKEMWDYVDILITTDPEILDNKIPKNKEIIKIKRPYNKNCNKSSIKPVIHINDLIENKEFQKLIKYKNK